MAKYDTAAQILEDVAVEVGLGVPSGDVFAATDANLVQLLYLLKSVGRGLVLEFPWLQLRKQHVFLTSTAVLYPLPADFSSMVDGTGWNRTARLPLLQVSDSQWQAMKATTPGVVLNILFRPSGGATEAGQLEVPAAPTAGQTLAFDYRSRHWVGSSTSLDEDAGTYSTVTAVLLGTAGTVVASGSLASVGVGALFASTAAATLATHALVEFHLYAVGDILNDGVGDIFVCTVAGTSAGTEDAPVDQATPQTWGTATFAYVGPGTAAASAPFQAVDSGPVAAAATTLNTIVTTTTGWSGLGNPLAATLGNGPDSDEPTAGTNLVFIDVQLMTRALKFAFLRAKGFDSTAAEADYLRALANVEAASVAAAPKLSLNGPRWADRLLGPLNVPITGYGS